ncbi:MAG: hypothetical protein IJE63_06450, partial [Clostridia bacterium]|nr:hypothetical protein [Clostridia bacterium]
MKRLTTLTLVFALTACVLSGCATKAPEPEPYEGTQIVLADSKITVDGAEISADTAQAVYTANDIVYYEEGHDFTYGEGTDADAHSKEEADAHTVVRITQPGQYVLSGKLSKGQIAVDLGDEAEENPEAEEENEPENVTDYAKKVGRTYFAHRRCAVLHGKMKGAEKEKIMAAFSSGEIDLLFAT